MTEMCGDALPPSLAESIGQLVRLMHPTMKAKTAAGDDEPDNQCSVEEKARVFSSLALPDETPLQDSIDGALAVLESLQSKNGKSKPRK